MTLEHGLMSTWRLPRFSALLMLLRASASTFMRTLEVKDLFVDIQDGKILMALLEVLSGRGLLHEYKSSSHRIFRLNNIAKALQFLEESSVKLVSIDAAEIADGNPSLVLGLIWNIIVFFQIKELTGNLNRNSPPSSLSPGSGGTDSDSSFPPTPTSERSTGLSVKDQRKAIRTLLAWVQRKTRKYGVAVQDFTGSWRSGLAFLAVIKAIDPSLVDMKQALEEPMRVNLEKAFTIAHDALHIPRLLEPEDIMVDTPDEQSIVTYVAQFLERFPEVDPDEAIDSDREAPIESTFVRIQEARAEPESKVLLLTENGERTYTVNETAQPPPAKVFVSETSGSVEESHLLDSTHSHVPLSDSPPKVLSGVMSQNSDGVGGSSSSSSNNEPLLESSILSCRKESRRSSSLPIKKTVHFEDTSYSKDTSFSFEGSPWGRAKGLSWQDTHNLAAGMSERKPKPEVTFNMTSKEVTSVADMDRPTRASSPPPMTSKEMTSVAGMHRPTRALSPPPCPSVASPPSSPVPAQSNVVLAPSLELKVQLLTTQALEEEDGFEGIPLKASRFNSDLVDYACTSQVLGEEPAVEEAAAEKPGKKVSKSARESPEPEEPTEPPLEASKPEVYEKAKRKSPGRRRRSIEDGSSTPEEPQGEFLANISSHSTSLETLDSRSQEGLDLRRSPPLSKISVIPHDLFYYPHYEVPLSAVLEAFAEGSEDVKNEEEELEEAENLVPDQEARGILSEPIEVQLPDSDQEFCPDWEAEAELPSPEPTPPIASEAGSPNVTPESVPITSQQEPSNLEKEKVANPEEAKVLEESTSTKKKEKRKHMDHVDSEIFTAPEPARSSDDLDDDISDHRIQSRTTHSDSSIYIRRHTNRSLESDHFSYVQLRNAAEVDDRRNRMLNRNATSSGEAMVQEGQGPRNDSLTQLVQQPDMMYFILFLWLLAYCLLLFPQLDGSRL